MAKLIKVDGEITELQPRNGEYFELEEMQGYVEGLIEPVYLPDGTIILVNEEGLLQNMGLNLTATLMAGFPLVGPALHVTDEEFR